MLAQVREGKTRKFWQQDGLLYIKGNRVYVPRADNLRKTLLKECHDTQWAGHPGATRTLALLERAFYWPYMGDEVQEYVKTCLICQQDKVEKDKPLGLLQPLPIPSRPWESVSLDFISALPTVGEYGSILVIVDRFSKYGTFIPAPKHCSGTEAAHLFFKNIIKLWGIPENIVSDRDARFTGRFWKELFKLLGTKLNFSTSMHPQTDGQTERENALLEEYLRHFVSANQKNWANLMDVAQFSYNLQRSSSTQKSPFELVTGRQPTTPDTLVAGYRGNSPPAYHFAKEWQLNLDIARAYLGKASKRQKKWADQGRRPSNFQVGDLVLVKLNPHQLMFFRKLHKGLVRKYEGPVPIIKKVGNVSYKVQLPEWLNAHPVFHASCLKPYHDDIGDNSRNVPTRGDPKVTKKDKVLEHILADRVVGQGERQVREFLVKWAGEPHSWEPEELLEPYADKVKNYLEAERRRGRRLD